MIGFAILIMIVIIFARIQKGMFSALLILIASKSIMDTFWDIKIGPFSILAVQGLIIPLLFLKTFTKIKLLPNNWKQTAVLYLLALSIGLIWAVAIKPMASIELIILNVNIFLGFFLIPLLVHNSKRLKQLLLAIMVAGIFPIAISFFQFQTGIIFRERETIGLTRYVGLYHDAFPVRFYGLLTLFAVLVYLNSFKPKKKWFTIGIYTLAIGALFSIYLVFSKAGIGVLGLWIVLLLMYTKTKFKYLFSIVLSLFVLFLIFGNVLGANIEQLFSKEIGYQTGEVKDVRYTLAGRGYIWQDYWEFWIKKQPLFFQWIGDGLSRPAHNEFLRVLLMNGIIGVLLLIVFIIRMIRYSFKIHRNVKTFGMMLLGMYLIDTIGLVPGVYYYYNILVWGLIGVFLLSPHLFIKNQNS